ncbi:MAG: hypothetical protein ABI321_22400 [Polyangia bacterium]
MARAVLLIGVVIAGLPGCLVPTPLSQRPGVGDSPPFILVDRAVPTYGPTIVRTDHSTFSFVVYARDVDLDDTLSARIYAAPNASEVSDTNPLVDYQYQVSPMEAAATDDPELRVADFDKQDGGKDYCRIFNPSVQTFPVKITVADRPFNASGDGKADGGLTDYIFWKLTCPQ